MRALKKYKYQPDYAVLPGDTLREVMESLEMTQKELAVRTGLTVQTLIRIFKGEQPISYESANRLELATGVPARFWNNLEAQYQEQKAKLDERSRMAKDLKWLKTIPVKELQKRKYLSETNDKVQLLRETLGFYGVGSVDAWFELWEIPAVAARRSPCFESQPGAASAWIRQGELQAQKSKCKPFDRAAFREALTRIRSLTKEKQEKFEPALKELCAETGVAVSLVQEMKKVPWNGATKWLSPQKAMILLSLRGKGEDKFWFSFFHEAGHVLHDNRKDILINDGSKDDPREVRADEFAAKFLVPPEYDRRIKGIQSKDDVLRLAEELDIAPSIVAGRFQFITGQWDHFRSLIRTLRWE